jgi:hypothetical protein
MSSDESGNEEGGALNLLLQSIDKKSRKTKQAERIAHVGGEDDDDQASSDNESDSEMGLEDDHELEYQMEESDVEEETAVPDDDVAGGDDNDAPEIDPFSSHFNREPFSGKDLAQAIAASQQTSKVSLPMLDSSLELQLNGGNEMEGAMSLFACNRKVLQRAWKRANATVLRGESKKQSLSSLQSALYPSLATYKDAFIAAETREVRYKKSLSEADDVFLSRLTFLISLLESRRYSQHLGASFAQSYLDVSWSHSTKQ